MAERENSGKFDFLTFTKGDVGDAAGALQRAKNSPLNRSSGGGSIVNTPSSPGEGSGGFIVMTSPSPGEGSGGSIVMHPAAPGEGFLNHVSAIFDLFNSGKGK